MIMNKKNRKGLSKIVALVLTSIIVMSGVAAKAFVVDNGTVDKVKECNANTKNLAVVVKDKVLNAIDMINGKEKEIDKDGDFKNPKVSQEGRNVAYIKDKILYISENFLEGKKAVVKVNDEPISFTWKDKDTLIYSLYKGGLYEFNLKEKTTSVYVDSQERYKNVVLGKDGKIYCEKYYDYLKDGEQYVAPKGIISFDISTKKETTIVEPRDISEEKKDMGLGPVISKISPDGNYMYIWMKARAGSMNADGVGAAIYDIDKGKLVTINKDAVLFLAYNDNIAINPIDNSKAVLNNGGNRFMSMNKSLIMINSLDGTWKEILPKDMISTSGVYGDGIKGIVTMTPNFSIDGKKVIYSATKAIESGEQWSKVPHNIYTVDIESQKIEQITNSNTFDFAPNYINSGKAIVFLRRISDKELQMFKIEEGKEINLVKGIKIEENSVYYGHYNLQGVMDVYIEK